MLDESQKARPHRIDKKDVETKRAMPREVCRLFAICKTSPVVENHNLTEGLLIKKCLESK